jgi:hypothetical protein
VVRKIDFERIDYVKLIIVKIELNVTSVFFYVCSELRCVKRKLLLEALANELPSGTIRYLSKVVAVEESGFSKVVHLSDGTTIKTKVHNIMCDITY